MPAGWRGLRDWFLCFLALGALALTEPLLDLYGKSPQVFVSSRSSRAQILAFALLATLAVPVICTAIVVVAGKVKQGADRVVAVPLGLVLGGAAGLIWAQSLTPDSTGAAFVLGLFGALLTLPLLQWTTGRRLLTYISALAPLSFGLFLFSSSTSPLLWEDEAHASDTAIGNPAPIVFLQLDELPVAELLTSDRRINEDLFPNFARLAEGSHWYRNAVSSSHATDVSVPGILTGTLTDMGADPSSRTYPDNLFTLLGGQYRLNVTEDVTQMCPVDLCPGPEASFRDMVVDAGVVYGHLTAPKAWQDDLIPIDGTWSGFAGQEEAVPTASGLDDLPVPGPERRIDWIDDFQRMINDIGPGPQPTLWFTHIRTPHPPWAVNPTGTHYHRPEDRSDHPLGIEDNHWVDQEEVSLSGLQRQLAQLGFVDRMLGRMLDRLDETGLWDDAVVVVLGDHGNSFRPGDNRRDPTLLNRSDIYRVPLFVHLPGQERGRIHDEPANGIDVMPTLVEVLEADVDWDFDGESLLHLPDGPRPHWYVPYGEAGPADTDIEELDELVADLDERIPDRSSWDAVANGDVTEATVGSSLADLRAEDGGLRWHIDQEETLDVVDRDNGLVPTVLTGQLEVPEEIESDELRVSVNGRIAGLGSFVRTGGESANFYAVLAEDLVPNGHLSIALLAEGPDGRWVTGGAADDLDPTYVDRDGDPIEPGPETGGLRIYVTRAAQTSARLIVEASAFHKIDDQPADRFLVYAGEHLLAETEPNVDTPSIAEANDDNQDLARTGLAIEIPSGDVPEGTRQVTVIAQIGDAYVAEGVTIR